MYGKEELLSLRDTATAATVGSPEGAGAAIGVGFPALLSGPNVRRHLLSSLFRLAQRVHG